MALIQCSECGGKVSDKALMCPHCGFGIQKNLGNLPDESKVPGKNQFLFTETTEEIRADDDRRTSKRIDLKMMAKINGEVAMLFNISKSGIKLSTTLVPKEPTVDITLEAGEKIFNLKGQIRWVSKKRSFSNLKDVGVEIIDAPATYYEFIDHLIGQK